MKQQGLGQDQEKEQDQGQGQDKKQDQCEEQRAEHQEDTENQGETNKAHRFLIKRIEDPVYFIQEKTYIFCDNHTFA